MSSEERPHSRAWYTRGGLYEATFDRVFRPTDSAAALSCLKQAVQLTSEQPGRIALIGAQRSFAPHFLPADSPGLHVGIDCTGLSGLIEVFPRSAQDRARGVLRVRAFGGTSLAQLVDAVSAHGNYFPFSLPTASAITLAGALAANTHSRSSATYGGLFADHVLKIRLLTASGQDLELSRDKGEEAELFRYVPGSLGALGLVAEVELELLLMDPSVVETEVLVRREGAHLTTLEDYLSYLDRNRREEGFIHAEGYGLVFFGHPTQGASFVMGRRRVPSDGPPVSTMPLFSGSRRHAALLQGLIHRYPRLGQRAAARLLPAHKKFQSDFRRWALFQDSYDDAFDLAREASGIWWALRASKLIDPSMTVVHQAWVTPTEGVRDFLATHFQQLEEPLYARLLRQLEFQDLVPLPTGTWPMSPNYKCSQGAHCFALSFATRRDRPELTRLAARYCEDLSQRVARYGSKVQLIKQLHVDTAQLRTMYETPLHKLRELRQEVDPEGLITSASLAKLGV